MTTENSQKSKKYVVTKMVRKETSDGYSPLIEKQLCRCDTLTECAEFIVNNDEYWYNCRYGKKLLNMKLADCIIKLKELKSDF
jgi:hypothetical protein